MLVCKNCKKEKDKSAFSKHSGCKIGYDTSRCKTCKKSYYEWKNTPLEKKIYNRVKARAKEKNIAFDLDLSDIVIPDACPVLNHTFIYGDLDWTYSVDRQNPNGGYTKDNILIISNKANRAKNNLTLDEFRKVLSYMEGIENNAQFTNN